MRSVPLTERFLAVVTSDDTAREWVCVTAGSGWVGCWSRSSYESSSADEFVEELRAQVKRVGRTGLYGPYLGDHLFFDGWETWGNGTPAPLAHLAPPVLDSLDDPHPE